MFMRIALLCVLATTACSAASPGKEDWGDVPKPGKLIYSTDFSKDATPAEFAKKYPDLETWGYFGPESAARAGGEKLPQSRAVVSRKWGTTLNVDIDDQYCPGALTPSAKDGALRITAYKFTPDDVAKCGQGRKWASALVTSRGHFEHMYGYWEAAGQFPCDEGRWPAFWLLPAAAKNPQNDGRLPEIDVFEHYGGVKVIRRPNGEEMRINRIGQPYSTIHTGVVGNEGHQGNGSKLPKVTDADRQAFCGAPHRFGLLWTPTDIYFYIDRRETFHVANHGIREPLYWLLTHDVSNAAGDPELHPEPSTFAISSVRVWDLAKK